MAASYNKVNANSHEEERERYWRAWSGNASCFGFIDFISICTFKIIWNTSLTGSIDVEAIRTNQTNQNALVDGCIVWLVFLGTMINTRVLIEKKVINASRAPVRFSIASLAWFLALLANTINGELR